MKFSAAAPPSNKDLLSRDIGPGISRAYPGEVDRASRKEWMMIAVSIGLRSTAVLFLGLALTMAPRLAAAQTSDNPAEINACLCLERAVETSSQSMNERTQALAAARQHLADLNAELAHERPLVNVNDQNSVDQYKALLERRDAAYRESIGPVVSEADQAVARYNALANQYDSQCANHPFNSAILQDMQAHLTCPAQP
jgi:hypothetical protein